MSFEIQNKISLIRDITSSEAFVLYRLADKADKDGYCFPGERLLSYETRLDPRTVRYVLMALEELGLIRRINEGRTGPGRRKKFQITLEQALTGGIIHNNVEYDDEGEPLPRRARPPKKKAPGAQPAPAPKEPATTKEPPVTSATVLAAQQQYEYMQMLDERTRLLDLIERAQRGEKFAVRWWESSGEYALKRLEEINQAIGMSGEVEEPQPIA